MKQSATLFLPILLMLASCGTPAQYSQQRFLDSIYADPEEVEAVELLTEEDFEYLAAENIARERGRDTLVEILGIILSTATTDTISPTVILIITGSASALTTGAATSAAGAMTPGTAAMPSAIRIPGTTRGIPATGIPGCIMIRGTATTTPSATATDMATTAPMAPTATATIPATGVAATGVAAA